MSIEEFIAELDAALSFEQARIKGYLGVLTFPNNLASDSSKQEIQEALEWSVKRNQLLENALNPVKALLEHGYPERVEQLASEAVIDELKAALSLLTLSVDELHEPPVLNIEVSEEA